VHWKAIDEVGVFAEAEKATPLAVEQYLI